MPPALGADGAIVDDGWAKEHEARASATRFSITSPNGTKLAPDGARRSRSRRCSTRSRSGPITISQAAFDRAFESDRDYLTFVRPAAGDRPRRRRSPRYPDAKAQTKSAYVEDQVTGDIDSLLAIFYVLLALAVIVSLFGIVNTLVLSTFERTRELGMLRAVGMTRRQVRRMVRHESIITALIGAGLGIAAGLGLAAHRHRAVRRRGPHASRSRPARWSSWWSSRRSPACSRRSSRPAAPRGSTR